MISKRTRKPNTSVESLKQGGITAVKGIDETASPLDAEHVQYMENLDIDSDGGLKLRKPILCVRQIQNYGMVDRVHYLFDKSHIFVATHSEDETSKTIPFYTIYNTENISICRLCYNSWEDSSPQVVNLTFAENTDERFYTNCLDFSDAFFTNTPTSTICTSVKVNILHPFLKDVFCNSALYDIPKEATEFLVYRTVIITKSKEPAYEFDFNIVVPELTSISNTETLRIDPNLNSDVPYTVRDTYDTSAPIVKNILPYVRTKFVENVPTYLPEDYTASEASVKSETYTNAYTPNVANLDNVGWVSGLSTDLEKVGSIYLTYDNLGIASLNWNPKNVRVESFLNFRIWLTFKDASAWFENKQLLIYTPPSEEFSNAMLEYTMDDTKKAIQRIKAEYKINVIGQDTHVSDFKRLPSSTISDLVRIVEQNLSRLTPGTAIDLETLSSYINDELLNGISFIAAPIYIGVPEDSSAIYTHQIRIHRPVHLDGSYKMQTQTKDVRYSVGVG